MFLKSLQMAVIPSKMHTENPSRPGRTWLHEGRGGRHVSQGGGLSKVVESNEPLWRVFPPKNGIVINDKRDELR